MAIRTLLDGLFDYAGMFPPAALSFEDALAESEDFPDALAHPWLVASDMVLTPAELPNLIRDHLHPRWSPRNPCKVCLVAVPMADADQLVAEALQWEHATVGYGQLTAVEIAVEEGANWTDLTEQVVALDRKLGTTTLYLEPRMGPEGWDTHGEGIWSALQGWRDAGLRIGLKIRCAGPTALDAPSLAKVLHRVGKLGIPFKATQGLHHPLSGMHGFDLGFLSLAFALRLAQSEPVDAGDLQALLQTTTVPDVTPEMISWQGHVLDVREIEDLRLNHPFSIGSCSLAEPDEDLSSLFGE